MKRRVLCILLALVVLVPVAGYFWLKSNTELVTDAISKAVESATGKPLLLDALPTLSIFPQIGLDLSSATWGDPKNDDLAIAVQEAHVRVAFMPLLSKKIEINEIRLESPHITVRGNPQNALQKPQKKASEKAEQGETSPSLSQKTLTRRAALSLDLVRINNGTLVVDLPDLAATFSKLDTTVSNLGLGKTSTLNLSTQMQAQARKKGRSIGQPLATQIVLKTQVTPQLPVFSVQDYTLKLTPIPGIVNAPMAFAGGLSFNTDTSELTLGKNTLSIADVTLALSGIVTVPKSSLPRFSLDFTAQGDVRALLEALNRPLHLRDPAAMKTVSLAGNFSWSTEGVFALSKLAGTLDDTTFSGNATSSSPRQYVATLVFDQLNLDRYLPASSSTQPATTPARTSATAAAPATAQAPPPKKESFLFPDLNIQVQAQRLIASGVQFDQLKTHMQGSQGKYTLHPSTATVYESAVSASGQANLSTQQIVFTVQAPNINAGKLLNDFAKTNAVTGRVNLVSNMNFRGTSEKEIRRSLTGVTTLTGKLDIDTALLPSSWGQIARAMRTINMNTINAKASASNGSITLDPLTGEGNLLSVRGQGQIQLPADTLNVRLEATLADIVLPLIIQGSLKKPSYTVDPAGLIRSILTAPAKQQGNVRAVQNEAKIARDELKALGKEAEKAGKELRNLFRGGK